MTRGCALRRQRQDVLEQAPTAPLGKHLRNKYALLKVDHAYDHRSFRIKGHVFKSPPPIELANLLINWMREHTEAPDLARSTQCCCQREQKERARVALTLIGLVYRQLPQQRRRHRVGLIALVRLGKKFALDLGSAQRHVAHDRSGTGVTDDACSGNAREVIMPGMALEPGIERVPPTIE